jgi:energy-coupling factor transporter ATP-binding protein EcfA2
MSVTAQINKALLEWSKALHPWQHEAFRRILAKGALTDQDKNEIYERAQIDLGFAAAPTPPPDVILTDADLPIATTQANRVWLVALKDLENVNALKPKQRLTVGKQLTLVYGENGSGKSGYARVLKKTARCTEKAVETILPDVFQTPSPSAPAKAIFELDKGTGPLDVHWQDGQPVTAELKRFAVFDSKCARHFLSDSNQLSFAPSVFDALRLLGEVTDAVKQKFLSLVRNSVPPTPPSYQFMVDKTSIGIALAAISVSTDPNAIATLGQWNEQDTTSLVTKEGELARLKTLSPQTIRQQLNREKRDAVTLQTKIAAVVSELHDTRVATLKQQVTEVQIQEQAFQAAVKLAFSDAKIEGVGSDAWKSLIETAAIFSTTEAYKEQPFPATIADSVCVLCQQPLGSDAATRLQGFWNFLQDDTAKKRDAAKQKLAATLTKLKSVPQELPTEVNALREEFEKNHPELWNATVDFYNSVPVRLTAVEKAVAGESCEVIPALDEQAAILVQQLVSALEAKLITVQDDANAQAEINKLTGEIAELNARKRLSVNLKFVTDHIAALKTVACAQKAADSIATNSISLKAKELHTTFITDAFKLNVKGQMKRVGLRQPKVAIDERSERGKVLHSITVEGANQIVSPENIFSEGERTAISLAFFLADLGSVVDTCGVIFDDPVTSLDHRIREGAINALVAESKQRQVIVFTHDLAFYCELISAATVAQVEVIPNHVESFSKTVGQLSGAEPREALKVTQRYTELEKLVKDAEHSANSDDFRNAVDRFYSLLRAAWERSVEELLFNQVVSRYQKEVMTQKLVGVAIDKDSIAAVFQGMTRGSDRTEAHDHAPGTVLPVPTVDDLKTHLQELKDFVTAQATKRKAAEKLNEHLKG